MTVIHATHAPANNKYFCFISFRFISFILTPSFTYDYFVHYRHVTEKIPRCDLANQTIGETYFLKETKVRSYCHGPTAYKMTHMSNDYRELTALWS